jgi:hypothetical protein
LASAGDCAATSASVTAPAINRPVMDLFPLSNEQEQDARGMGRDLAHGVAAAWKSRGDNKANGNYRR